MALGSATSGDLDDSALGGPRAGYVDFYEPQFPNGHTRRLNKIAYKVSSNASKPTLLNPPKDSGCL